MYQKYILYICRFFVVVYFFLWVREKDAKISLRCLTFFIITNYLVHKYRLQTKPEVCNQLVL